ncbi:SDR family oxidoreductase [Micromonospora zamorensis]|uniref:SDR family oxidoreductase n=1 Tax=Micromonospora zamorensis TaxID=709883 RepID=UPI001E4136B9|nr:SDR family oxidoreductase [Micromonospora zamorensis]
MQTGRGTTMKIVVIGGSGLIGSKLVDSLAGQGHEAVPASPKTGVNTLTGEGVADVLTGAEVVVDVSNSPSFEDKAVLEFFETSTRTLLGAASDEGVGHYVALSIVGCDRIPDSGYMRAKVAQEKLIVASGTPYSIVHATQFFEFLQGIIDAGTDGDTVHLAPVLIKPMAADDVAAAVAEAAVAAPTNAVVEVAGPEQFRLDELGRSMLAARQDPRSVVADPDARYFGAKLGERSLVPTDGARIAGTRLDDWRARTAGGR